MFTLKYANLQNSEQINYQILERENSARSTFKKKQSSSLLNM